ncbi:DUF6527 family protein [Nonomuraea sp. CA-141351]|uniref:DUF6527 family protein n=1 Tax=Nonomuraea sp. CA-141351 TaxID=3239996 RepID=UPI003D90B88A
MKGWRTHLSHDFVDHIPERLETGRLYVSIRHATAVHLCACGCGNEVVTPLSPTDWRLTYDGESISLYPSVGNWSFACQSHYWIDKSAVRPAPRWSKERIATGRARDLAATQHRFATVGPTPGRDPGERMSLRERVGSWISRRLRTPRRKSGA